MSLKCKSRKKRKFRLLPFKLPTATTILFLIIAFIVIISWIPGTTTRWTDSSGVSHGGPLGFFDLFYAPIQGFITNSAVFIYILVIGGYLGLVMKSKALDAGIGRLVKKLKGKEIWIIPVIMTVLSIAGTVEGMCEETIPYYLVIIPALVAAGFDVITGVFVILLGAGVGVMFSTLNPFSIGVASPIAGVSTGDGIIWRLVAWAVGTIATIAFVMWYAIRIKKHPEKSVVFDLKETHEEAFLNGEELPEFNKKRKIILSLFGLTFIVMIACIIPWDSLLHVKTFENADSWIKQHIPYITGSGSIPAFGTWSTLTLALLFFFASIVIAAVDWNGEAKYIEEFVDGGRELLGVAFIVAVASGIGWALQVSGMQEQILNALSSKVQGLPRTALTLFAFLIFLILAFFIPSTSGLASASMLTISQLVAPLHLQTGIITSFVMASGWINLFAPSAGVMMAGLAIAKVPLNKFYKAIWPYMIIITLLIIALLAVGSLLPASIF